MLISHNLVDNIVFDDVLYELKPCLDTHGMPVEGVNNAWITLNNPSQFNSYTTEMIKKVILGMRQASNDRTVANVIFTAVGDKAFCTGGNTKEYAEYYSGNPQEYKQYMRLFNDMVSSILMNDKPVICRVNGMRIAGGQEIGMACDFTIAQDLARFGQAGPKHGSAPDGGSTDFLPLFVGIERAMYSCTACDPWSAHEAFRYGLITEIAPALNVDGKFIPNPMVYTNKWVDDFGNLVYGSMKSGDDLAKAKELLKSGTVDLSMLDLAVERLATKLMLLMPNCISKTLNSLRKHKLMHWDRNKESNRDWLALNMMTEGKAGFRAFNEGAKGHQEVDFIKLRQRLSEGHPWDDELLSEIFPKELK